MWILTANLAPGPCFQTLYQICWKYMQYDRVMAQNLNFNMAAATILDFVCYGYWWSTLFRDLIFRHCVKFGADLFKNGHVIAFNWFQDGGHPPSWILANVNFDDKSGSGTLFSACVSNSVKMCPILTKLWPKMWFSIWRPPPYWILSAKCSNGQNSLEASFSVSLSNLVRICSKMLELWPFNCFQNGGRHHLEFTSGVSVFYQLVVLA